MKRRVEKERNDLDWTSCEKVTEDIFAHKRIMMMILILNLIVLMIIDDDKEDNDVAGDDYDNVMLKVIMQIWKTMSMVLW